MSDQPDIGMLRQLVDRFEDNYRDRRLTPLERKAWHEAWDALAEVVGGRKS